MKETTWRRLEQEAAARPMLFAGPVPPVEVEDAARELGVRFDPDYFEFVSRFGGAIVGPDRIFGLRRAEAMGVGEFVVDETRRFRDQRWPGVESWYVISTDGGGSPIGMDGAGRVWLSDHGEIVERAATFEAFLLERLR